MSHQYAVASTPWPDHLVFREGDCRLNAVDALDRRFATSRDVFGTEIVRWREVRTRSDLSHYYASADNRQNYIDGKCMPGLLEHLQETYAPVFFNAAARLYIARQWVDSDERAEQGFLSMSCVSGLVFSTSASTTCERWPKAALWRSARPRGPSHKSADWLDYRRCPKRFPTPDD
jgi:hypothetical protein